MQTGTSRAIAGAIAIVLGVAAVFMPNGAVQTQSPAAPRYPWDHRPTKCFAEDAPALGDCKLENWPTFGLTSRRLAILYFNRQ